METVGKAVAGLEDVPSLVPLLKELGRKHTKYGVKEEHCEGPAAGRVLRLYGPV